MTHPRLRDLTEPERAIFKEWLRGQTVPVDDSLPDEEQDFYYRHDYEIWKESRIAGWQVWD
jgi:hypothetical protein